MVIIAVSCIIILLLFLLRKGSMKTITLKQRLDKLVKELDDEGE